MVKQDRTVKHLDLHLNRARPLALDAQFPFAHEAIVAGGCLSSNALRPLAAGVSEGFRSTGF
jgi:hypothetical protein